MIITKIKASNFYGIKDPVEVSFTKGGDITRSGYGKVNDQNVSLISGFYGANASGKSTILNIIDTVIRIMLFKQKEVVFDANHMKQDMLILKPNYHLDMETKPSILEISFIINNNNYDYKVAIIKKGKEISKEELIKNNKKIFTRENDKIFFNSKIAKEVNNIINDIKAPKKSSFLSVILDDDSDVSVFGDLKKTIGIFELKEIKNKVCFITDKRSVQMRQDNISGMLGLAVNYINKFDPFAEQDVIDTNSVVKYFEPSFEKLNISKQNEKSFKYTAKYNDFYQELPVIELSAGTREIVAYISKIIRIIKTGGIVVYDETSKYYHPDMEIAILGLFKDKEINKNNAQIFFSSHNHETFDLLLNSQAHIVEKDNNNNITVAKVSSFDVKERDNIKRIYRLGSLGGIPDSIDFNRVINNLF